MDIKKGELVKIKTSRKGEYIAEALKDFNTWKDDWFPVKVAQDKPVYGMTKVWRKGDEIPCRKSLVKHITKVEK